VDMSPGEELMLRSFGFLSQKPVLVVVNCGDEPCDPSKFVRYDHRHAAVTALQGKLEMEIAQMPPDEATGFLADFGIAEPGRMRVIRLSYDLLGLHSFLTVGDDECRAWTIRRGATALESGRRDSHRFGQRLYPRRSVYLRRSDGARERSGGQDGGHSSAGRQRVRRERRRRRARQVQQ